MVSGNTTSKSRKAVAGVASVEMEILISPNSKLSLFNDQ